MLRGLILAQAGFEVLKSGGDALDPSSGTSNRIVVAVLAVLVVGLVIGGLVTLLVQRRRASQSRFERQQEHLK
ncbi:MAG TPA: hypothetical protein VF678_10425, partial [bacterium]